MPPPRAARTGASSPSPGPPAPAARRPIVVLGENDARGGAALARESLQELGHARLRLVRATHGEVLDQ